jgi:hypothetical protein
VLQALAHYRSTPLTPAQVQQRAERDSSVLLMRRAVHTTLGGLVQGGFANALRYSEGYRYTITEDGRREASMITPDEVEPSFARMGLDLLLERFPTRDVVSIGDGSRSGGVWLVVRFADDARYVIWRNTGHIYEMDDDGGVGDDPVIENPAYQCNDCSTIR